MSKVYKDSVTITISRSQFDEIIYAYGLAVGSFQENEELVLDKVEENDEEIILRGSLYQEGLN